MHCALAPRLNSTSPVSSAALRICFARGDSSPLDEPLVRADDGREGTLSAPALAERAEEGRAVSGAAAVSVAMVGAGAESGRGRAGAESGRAGRAERRRVRLP